MSEVTTTKEESFRIWIRAMLWNRNIPTPTQCVAFLGSDTYNYRARNLNGTWSKIRIEEFSNFDLYGGLERVNGRWRWKDGWKP